VAATSSHSAARECRFELGFPLPVLAEDESEVLGFSDIFFGEARHVEVSYSKSVPWRKDDNITLVGIDYKSQGVKKSTCKSN
jgi:hypothetical protein